MKLRNLKLLGVILAFVFCFPLHFLYDKLPCFLTSIIAPVNESIWEHMKILFGSIILSGVIQKIIIKSKKLNFRNVCFSNFVAAITSIPIFLIIYLPIYNAIGESITISIILMFIIIVISQIIACFIIKQKELHLENVTIALVIITYIVFGILTYNPIKIDLFKDPITISYGIEKSS